MGVGAIAKHQRDHGASALKKMPTALPFARKRPSGEGLSKRILKTLPYLPEHLPKILIAGSNREVLRHSPRVLTDQEQELPIGASPDAQPARPGTLWALRPVKGQLLSRYRHGCLQQSPTACIRAQLCR